MQTRDSYTDVLPSYSVGADAYTHVWPCVKRFGCRAAIVGGKRALEAFSKRFYAAIQDTDLSITSSQVYGTNCTHANSRALAVKLKAEHIDMLFAVGGGRAIDQCKELADLLDVPLFTFPTLASNCAPVTRLAVNYKEDGSLDDYYFPREPPKHAFIDTEVLAASPDTYFWAGIGDATSKGIEVELASRDLDLPHTPLMGRALAMGACAEPLLEHGFAAMEAKRAGKSSVSLEQVVLNIIITAGLVSNMTVNLDAPICNYYFNSSVAHAFYNAYTSLSAIAHKHLHGEVVSFGSLVLLAFDNQTDELSRLYDFNKALGLPCTLEDLEITESWQIDQIVEMAQKTTEWGRAPYGYTPERYRQAIVDADVYGRARAEADEAAIQKALEAIAEHRAKEATERRIYQ